MRIKAVVEAVVVVVAVVAVLVAIVVLGVVLTRRMSRDPKSSSVSDIEKRRILGGSVDNADEKMAMELSMLAFFF